MEANKVKRRDFLKVAGITGAFFAVGFESFALTGGKAELKTLMAEDFINGVPMNPFVIIPEEGKITMMAHIPELGQGIFQGIPAIIAEELDVDMDQVEIVKSSASRAYGRQSIGGSRSIRTQFMPMRKLGALTRYMLVSAAAQKWGVDYGECSTKSGKVIHTSGKHLTYGELAITAKNQSLSDEYQLKEKSDFKIIGKSTKRPDLANKVNGQADYGMDARPEGLLYATVERCPTLQGKLTNYDKSAAMAVSGVVDVLEIIRNVYGKQNTGIAVVAQNQYAALQGRKKLNPKWDNAEFTQVDTARLFSDMEALSKEAGMEHIERGDFASVSSSADNKLDAIYKLPYLSHSCMEPMNATVHVRPDNTAEVWASSQSPQVQGTIAKDLGIPQEQAEEKIMVHMPFMGGGFGRRSMNDSFEECYQISKALRKPVKLVWSREDDTSQGPFRQGTVHRFAATFNDKDQPTGMQTKMVSQAITTQGRDSRGRIPFEVMESINTHYAFEHMSVRYNEYKSQIPIHWWRSVFAATNGPAYEAFIDEMAVKSGQDPLAFRKDYLKDEPRFVKVLERLEKESGWNVPLGKNEGKGIAVVESFGTIVAQALFLKKENGKVTIPRVVAVVDCGIYINPDQVKAQTEGNIIFGLTAALKDPITFKNGAAEQANFDTYRMLRMNEAPRSIEVHLVDNDEAPGGVGEPGLPPIAAALMNAVANMTGKRMRELPFNLQSI